MDKIKQVRVATEFLQGRAIDDIVAELIAEQTYDGRKIRTVARMKANVEKAIRKSVILAAREESIDGYEAVDTTLSCEGCAFETSRAMCSSVHCVAPYRSDGRDVIFRKVSLVDPLDAPAGYKAVLEPANRQRCGCAFGNPESGYAICDRRLCAAKKRADGQATVFVKLAPDDDLGQAPEGYRAVEAIIGGHVPDSCTGCAFKAHFVATGDCAERDCVPRERQDRKRVIFIKK